MQWLQVSHHSTFITDNGVLVIETTTYGADFTYDVITLTLSDKTYIYTIMPHLHHCLQLL